MWTVPSPTVFCALALCGAHKLIAFFITLPIQFNIFLFSSFLAHVFCFRSRFSKCQICIPTPTVWLSHIGIFFIIVVYRTYVCRSTYIHIRMLYVVFNAIAIWPGWKVSLLLSHNFCCFSSSNQFFTWMSCASVVYEWEMQLGGGSLWCQPANRSVKL